MADERIALSLKDLQAKVARLREEAAAKAQEADGLEALIALAVANGVPLSEGRPLFPDVQTADLLEKILVEHGKLHIDTILDKLYENKWTGSGDRRLDYKNVFSNLAGKPKRFKKVGKGFFELASL